jgi:hypothetical protein
MRERSFADETVEITLVEVQVDVIKRVVRRERIRLRTETISGHRCRGRLVKCACLCARGDHDETTAARRLAAARHGHARQGAEPVERRPAGRRHVPQSTG